jgi:predicted RecA/RadA family phage recombinase
VRFGLGIGLAVAHFASPGLEDGETGSATMTEQFTMAIAGTEAGETGTQIDTEIFTMSIASTEADEVGASGNTVTMSVAGAEATETGAASVTETFTMAVASTEAVETCAATMTNTAPNPIPGLPGLKFYVDAATTPPHVSSGSNIDLWTDLSGVGNSLNTIPTLANAPQRGGDNSLDTLAASSRAIVHPAANSIGTGHYCVGIVIKIDALIDGSILFGDSDVNVGGVNLKIAGNKWSLEHYAVGGNVSVADAPTDTYHILIGDRAAGAAPVLYLDGSAISLSGTTSADPIASGTGLTSGLCMGTFGNFAAAFASCKILAAFICNSDIGSSSVAAVQAYWKGVYGTP